MWCGLQDSNVRPVRPEPGRSAPKAALAPSGPPRERFVREPPTGSAQYAAVSPRDAERPSAARRRARVPWSATRLWLLALLAVAVFLAQAEAARAETCFGAPPGVRTQFPEPRVFEEAQAWWLERGTTRQILRIRGAMRANHVHLGLCFPQGQKIHPRGGRIHYSLRGMLHNFRRGVATFVRGGVVETGPRSGFKQGLGWKPRASDEERVFRAWSRTRRLRVCGRREWRFTLNALNPHRHRRQFQSFGSQAYVPCRGKRKRNNYRRSDAMIFRGWYKGSEYTNVGFGDESGHRYRGFRAWHMQWPVPTGWEVTWGVSEGARRFVLTIDPDIHHGSFGRVVARGRMRSGASRRTRIPVESLSPGIHRLMLVGCEGVRRPRGAACGVGVIPFLVG